MCIRSMSGNRESSEETVMRSYRQSGRGRPGPQSRRVHFRAVGQANSTGEAVEQSSFNHKHYDQGAAEVVEERGLTKGNLLKFDRCRTL